MFGFLMLQQEPGHSNSMITSNSITAGMPETEGSQQKQGANNRGTPKTARMPTTKGMTGMLETPVAEETSTAVGKT
jgi:hypothetical protein